MARYTLTGSNGKAVVMLNLGLSSRERKYVTPCRDRICSVKHRQAKQHYVACSLAGPVSLTPYCFTIDGMCETEEKMLCRISDVTFAVWRVGTNRTHAVPRRGRARTRRTKTIRGWSSTCSTTAGACSSTSSPCS